MNQAADCRKTAGAGRSRWQQTDPGACHWSRFNSKWINAHLLLVKLYYFRMESGVTVCIVSPVTVLQYQGWEDCDGRVGKFNRSWGETWMKCCWMHEWALRMQTMHQCVCLTFFNGTYGKHFLNTLLFYLTDLKWQKLALWRWINDGVLGEGTPPYCIIATNLHLIILHQVHTHMHTQFNWSMKKKSENTMLWPNLYGPQDSPLQ